RGARVHAFADAVGAEHVVANALERAVDYVRRHAEAGVERAVEVCAQPHWQLALPPQAHRVAVALDEVDRGAGEPHVGDHGEPEAGGEVEYLRRAALAI